MLKALPVVIGRRRGLRWSRLVTHTVLIVASFLAVAPVVWLVLSSFKPYRELVSGRTLVPEEWTLQGYLKILEDGSLLDGFRNSFIIASITTATVLLTSASLGYVFSKYRFPGKETLFKILLATMMVPFTVVLIPLYVTIVDLGLSDHIGAIILTGLFSAFGVFLMRQFIDTIPSELLDAGRIDGASELLLFRRIIVPLTRSPLAALGVFNFLGQWDSFLWPSAVLRSTDSQTLPLVLSGFQSLFIARYDLWLAGGMLTLLPVMLVYAFASRHFVRGFAGSGLNG